tara:strand:- start:388 stop:531 length:144 start_codon:yes stop_codon:yes gene_type:complete
MIEASVFLLLILRAYIEIVSLKLSPYNLIFNTFYILNGLAKTGSLNV